MKKKRYEVKIEDGEYSYNFNKDEEYALLNKLKDRNLEETKYMGLYTEDGKYYSIEKKEAFRSLGEKPAVQTVVFDVVSYGEQHPIESKETVVDTVLESYRVANDFDARDQAINPNINPQRYHDFVRHLWELHVENIFGEFGDDHEINVEDDGKYEEYFARWLDVIPTEDSEAERVVVWTNLDEFSYHDNIVGEGYSDFYKTEMMKEKDFLKRMKEIAQTK